MATCEQKASVKAKTRVEISIFYKLGVPLVLSYTKFSKAEGSLLKEARRQIRAYVHKPRRELS
jgi:hypothetical protein